jgi:hypothetical protein
MNCWKFKKCGSTVQGTFAQKLVNFMDCEFYKKYTLKL